jgi:hypothetical protein
VIIQFFLTSEPSASQLSNYGPLYGPGVLLDIQQQTQKDDPKKIKTTKKQNLMPSSVNVVTMARPTSQGNNLIKMISH